MKTLFISTYYNNPAFVGLQFRSLKGSFVGDYDFLVANDAAEDTVSIVDGKPAAQEIQKECSAYGVLHVRVPQEVHACEADGGLVPDGLPAQHPTERHRACLHWILQSEVYSGYDILVLAESDMFPRVPVNVKEYLGDLDILGTGRKDVVLKRTDDPNQYWPKALKETEVTLSFMTMYLTVFNLRTVTNLRDMNIGGFAGTDTGGQTGLFLRDNPQYKYGLINIGGSYEDQVDFFSKDRPDESAEFVHYRGGSNWDHQSKEYYNEKLSRMLRKYVPFLADSAPASAGRDLTSRDGEHVFRA